MEISRLLKMISHGKKDLWRTRASARPRTHRPGEWATSHRAPEMSEGPGVSLDALVGDPEATGLLIIDMQNDFLLDGAPVRASGGIELVPVIAALAGEFRRAGLPVVFTQEMHRADGSDFGIELKFEPLHCLQGSGGEEPVAGLEPQPGDFRITNKRRYDAF